MRALNVSVMPHERMPYGAFCPEFSAPMRVLLRSNDLKMARIHASTIAAEMVRN